MIFQSCFMSTTVQPFAMAPSARLRPICLSAASTATPDPEDWCYQPV